MMMFSAGGVIMLQGVTLFKLGPFMKWHNTKRSQMDYISLFFPSTNNPALPYRMFLCSYKLNLHQFCILYNITRPNKSFFWMDVWIGGEKNPPVTTVFSGCRFIFKRCLIFQLIHSAVTWHMHKNKRSKRSYRTHY
jgi:hypothetical protein